MSKFEVGDKVAIAEPSHTNNSGCAAHGLPVGSEWEVLYIHGRGEKLTIPCGNGFARPPARGWVHSSCVVPAEPSVPDVDGNPIQVGALVEDALLSEEGATHRFFRIGRVIPDDLMVGSTASGALYNGSDLRVLTADDLHRPPVPDTRDVTLRVTLTMQRNDEWDIREWATEVRKGIEASYGADMGDGTLHAVTVEVIEDGDSHNGFPRTEWAQLVGALNNRHHETPEVGRAALRLVEAVKENQP